MTRFSRRSRSSMIGATGTPSSLIFSISKVMINPLLVLGGSSMLANQEIGSLAAKLAGRTIRGDAY